jgi:glycolate oxidase
MTSFIYNKINDEILEKLKSIVGEKNVITEFEKMEPYSHDFINEKGYSTMPEAVVKPKTAVEISEIVKLANAYRFPITPRGAGSGLSGGAVAVYGGIVLSLERMNSIIEIDRYNMMAVVEPGVVTNEINEKTKEFGLFYAGYPMSLETCFIGGNVAHNAGGGKAIKYGVTERYILGLEMVTPTGEIIEIGGKRVKDVTGYNLRLFLVGSEGTLGIITKVILKLLPIPRVKVALLALFPDIKTAVGIVPKMITLSGVVPTAIELMDRISVEYTCRYLNEKIPYEQSGAMLLIEVDGADEAVVERDYDAIGNICMEYGAQEVYVADNYTTQERLWNIRKNLGEALILYNRRQSIEDIVVPPARIPELADDFAKISCEFEMPIMVYGHAGDGNIHANIVINPDDDEEAWQRKLPLIQEKMFIAAKKLGGTISGEHGIGLKRKKFLNIVLSEDEIEFMRKIKKGVDPNYILNPGKIFDL